MKHLKTLVFALFVLNTACTGSATLSPARSDQPASSRSSAANSAAAQPLAESPSYSATKKAGSSTVEDVKTQLASQKVTLDQATDTQTAPINLDRKVIR